MRKQTANVLSVRNPVGRPRKEPAIPQDDAVLTTVTRRTVRFSNNPILTPVKEHSIFTPQHELPGVALGSSTGHDKNALMLPTGNID